MKLASRGQGLLETIIGLSILVVTLTAIAFLAGISTTLSITTEKRSHATFLAQEGMEIIKNFKDRNWGVYEARPNVTDPNGLRVCDAAKDSSCRQEGISKFLSGDLVPSCSSDLDYDLTDNDTDPPCQTPFAWTHAPAPSLAGIPTNNIFCLGLKTEDAENPARGKFFMEAVAYDASRESLFVNDESCQVPNRSLEQGWKTFVGPDVLQHPIDPVAKKYYPENESFYRYAVIEAPADHTVKFAPAPTRNPAPGSCGSGAVGTTITNCMFRRVWVFVFFDGPPCDPRSTTCRTPRVTLTSLLAKWKEPKGT